MHSLDLCKTPDKLEWGEENQVHLIDGSYEGLTRENAISEK